GGMPLWHSLGLPINFAPPVAPPAAKNYKAAFHPELVADRHQILGLLGNDNVAILDARAAERFTGASAELRPGLKVGHIPGSYSLPFQSLIAQPGGTLIENDSRIAELVKTNPDKIITSCGSG